MPWQRTGDWSISLLGASTLLGKEVKAVFEERKIPLRRIQFVDTEEAQGQLSEFEGEPVLLTPVTPETFHEKDLAIFASEPGFTLMHWRQAREGGCRIIDLSFALEREATASCRAPLIEHFWKAGQNGKDQPTEPGTVAVSAHPMGIALAGILRLLSLRVGVVRAAATMFEPASTHGRAGVEELHQQTVNLLSFQEIPRKVFDAQLSFNLLNRNGEQSQPTLREGEGRIASHLRTLLRGCAPQPALRLLQAPVFHGYSFNCWVELAKPAELEIVLHREPFSVRPAPEDQPNAVSAASSDVILLGAVERDAANDAGYWIWGAFDNLRIAALNTERIAAEMLDLDSRATPSSRGSTAAEPLHQS